MVVGYHGCDASIIDDVLRGRPLMPSDNVYDWLGTGVYFWEYGPARALEFARAKAKRDASLGRPSITKPAVIGAYINLGRCFDLADTRYTATAKLGRAELLASLNESGERLPVNAPGLGDAHGDLLLRNLDCAVLNYTLRDDDFDTVRGIFVEGTPAYVGAGFAAKSHIQVAVRNPGAVIGYFLPR